MYHTAEAKIFRLNTGLDTSENVHAEKNKFLSLSLIVMWELIKGNIRVQLASDSCYGKIPARQS